MFRIVRSELLKMRRTFSLRLVILAPPVTLLLGYLLSGSYVQLSAYNWWYSMILPFVVSLCSAGMIVREKKNGMQNMVCLPVRVDKIWLGKTAAFVILLFAANLLLWILTTAVGFAAKVTVSPMDGLIGCTLLFLTYIWQIPFIMLLVNFMGYIPAVLVSLAANMILSAVGAEAEWFLFVPYAIPARIVYPFFKMHANGIPLESGSPLLSGEHVLPALMTSLVFALSVFWSSSKLVSRGGRTHGRILPLPEKRHL